MDRRKKKSTCGKFSINSCVFQCLANMYLEITVKKSAFEKITENTLEQYFI